MSCERAEWTVKHVLHNWVWQKGASCGLGNVLRCATAFCLIFKLPQLARISDLLLARKNKSSSYSNDSVGSLSRLLRQAGNEVDHLCANAVHRSLLNMRMSWHMLASYL